MELYSSQMTNINEAPSLWNEEEVGILMRKDVDYQINPGKERERWKKNHGELEERDLGTRVRDKVKRASGAQGGPKEDPEEMPRKNGLGSIGQRVPHKKRQTPREMGLYL